MLRWFVGSGDTSGGGGENGQAQREQTDESLRLERDRADAGASEKIEALEQKADEIVRIARERADAVVQTARDDADDTQGPQSTAAEALSDRERSDADVTLEAERSKADAELDRQRDERKRYLADFLAVERDATDRDLIRERAHTDTVVAARDEFLATVSHDLRSLLGGLSLNAQLVLKYAPQGPDGERIRKHASLGQRLVVRMNRLVNDLLDIASIEAGQLAVLSEQVEVSKILRDTLDAFEPIAAAKRIALDGKGVALPVHAPMDGGRILQVLANLVSNAIKFTPEDGRVSIRVVLEGSEIAFAVSDTGIGIPEDALEAVFRRFHQVSRDRRGLGLGLHISKCIVEAHGGRMWVESKLGSGSTFHFALPAAPLLPRQKPLTTNASV